MKASLDGAHQTPASESGHAASRARFIDSNKLLVLGVVPTAVDIACSIFSVVEVVYEEAPAMVATADYALVYGLLHRARQLSTG